MDNVQDKLTDFIVAPAMRRFWGDLASKGNEHLIYACLNIHKIFMTRFIVIDK